MRRLKVDKFFFGAINVMNQWINGYVFCICTKQYDFVTRKTRKSSPIRAKFSHKIGQFMATWNSRGLRGSTLEDMINRTNEKYLEHGLALIQKIPTPITPIKIDKDKKNITLAYFEQKSTVDYIGAVQGIPICFDAKECATDTFSLQNIHEHQIEFMKKFEEQGGISFIIIFYSHKNVLYYLTQKKLTEFWNRSTSGGRKSFRFEELEDNYFISKKNGILVPFLDALQIDLENRE